MAFMTVMLSVVRGIAVDILWYRAESLQQEGKFYEINQLCELIASLQPYFEEVWVFHSWNMAFNISVLTKTPDERWDWINKGIILLRDQGIPLNPKSATMYKELDWLFYFKIGQYSDDFNWYYKAKLAMEWQQLLGASSRAEERSPAPRPPTSSPRSPTRPTRSPRSSPPIPTSPSWWKSLRPSASPPMSTWRSR